MAIPSTFRQRSRPSDVRIPARPPAASPALSTAAQRLRAAGLRVTSIRIAALRLVPEALADYGQLTPQGLHAVAARHGYTFSAAAFHQVLPRLHTARLLPCAPSIVRRGRSGSERAPAHSTRSAPHAR